MKALVVFLLFGQHHLGHHVPIATKPVVAQVSSVIQQPDVDKTFHSFLQWCNPQGHLNVAKTRMERFKKEIFRFRPQSAYPDPQPLNSLGANPKDTILIKLKNRNKMMLITNNGDLNGFREIDLNAIVLKLDSTRYAGGTYKAPDSTIKLKPRTYKVTGSETITLVQINADIRKDMRKMDSAFNSYKEWRSERKRRRTTSQFDLDFGLNFYLQDGGQVDSRSNFLLDNLNSRYIALRWLQKTRIGGNSSSHHIMYGLELAWYNFKFSKKQKLEQDANGDLIWTSPTDPKDSYEDSKLTVAFLNVPIMYYYQPGNGVRLGFGGYAGYKLDEYNKVTLGGKVIRGGEGDFNLNNLQYGVRAQAGWRGIDLFCNYNLQPLFRKDKGPNLTPIAIGISL